MITLDQFRQLVKATSATAAAWYEPMLTAMSKYHILDERVVAAFLAQISHESNGLATLQENLNYSADGLANTWPKRYAVDPQSKPRKPNQLALKIARNPRAIANQTYANRFGNGSVESGDGWLYRGRGPKQLTFKDNYGAYQTASGFKVLENPDLLLTPEVGSDSAAWYWHTHDCTAMILRGDFTATTLAINGGLIGADQREQKYKDNLKVVGLA
jgi:putative chitinase